MPGRNSQAITDADRMIARAPAESMRHSLEALAPGRRAAAERAVALDGGRTLAHHHAVAALVCSGRTAAGIARSDRGIAAGPEPDVVGRFAADLIAAGAIVEAIRLRARY